MAWLHAVPERKTVKGAAMPGPRQSRLERMHADGLDDVPLPPIPAECGAVWEHLLQIGPAAAGSLGDGPIEWREMQAWQRLTGWPLSPWEARTLRRLSRAYLNERSAAADPARPAPWAAVSQRQRDAVGRSLALNLRALAQAQRQEKRS